MSIYLTERENIIMLRSSLQPHKQVTDLQPGQVLKKITQLKSLSTLTLILQLSS